jgi:hypothetical protein
MIDDSFIGFKFNDLNNYNPPCPIVRNLRELPSMDIFSCVSYIRVNLRKTRPKVSLGRITNEM